MSLEMQAVLSWGLVLGTGAGLARDTATLILGQYFRSTSTGGAVLCSQLPHFGSI